MKYGEAIELAKKGKLISRMGWNGKGMFVFMRPADKIPFDTVVNKIVSLPQAVKDYYANLTIDEVRTNINPDGTITFTAYLCIKAADGSIVNGWLASQSDMLAEDWLTFEKTRLEEL